MFEIQLNDEAIAATVGDDALLTAGTAEWN
jgi:hypothetical protein